MPARSIPEGCIGWKVGLTAWPLVVTFPRASPENQKLPDNGASPAVWMTVVMIRFPILRCSSVKRC
jgi:hypothetical protein